MVKEVAGAVKVVVVVEMDKAAVKESLFLDPVRSDALLVRKFHGK